MTKKKASKKTTSKARGKTGKRLSQRQSVPARFQAVARGLALLSEQTSLLNETNAELVRFLEALIELNGLKVPPAPEEQPAFAAAPTDANGSPVESV